MKIYQKHFIVTMHQIFALVVFDAPFNFPLCIPLAQVPAHSGGTNQRTSTHSYFQAYITFMLYSVKAFVSGILQKIAF